MKLLPKKKFTLRVANSMLPLVQSITSDIVTLSDEVNQTRIRLEYLSDGHIDPGCDDEYKRELASIERVTDQKSERIGACIQELNDLGLRTGNVESGFVDFPGERLNDRVCLCWQLGERGVRYWHLEDEDCSQRRPVDLELIRLSGELTLI
jgi:hypothetical protein